ncbi:2361_t:CDS:2, partial [Funneliformis mosseae]
FSYILKDILNSIAKDNISASFPIQKNHHKNSPMISTIKKKQEDSVIMFILQATLSKDQDLNVEYYNILPNLPFPFIQIPIGEINELDDLAVNIKKDQSAKSKKKIPEKSVSKVLKASISSSTGKSDAMITDFPSISPKYTGIKRKKLEAFDDLQTKHQFTDPEKVRYWKNSEKVKKVRHDLWNKMDNNDLNLLFVIETILQKAFTKEELQNQDNIKFENDRIEELLKDDRIEKLLEYDIIDHNSNELFISSDNEFENSNG